MAVHEELEGVMAGGRWADLRPYLQADPGSAVGRATRTWYRSRRAHWMEHYRFVHWGRDPDVDGRGALRALTLGLATPTQAVNDLGRLTFGWRRGPADDLGIDVAVARGRDFCQPFLDAAARLTFGKDEEWNVGWVARFGLPLVVAGVAELPEGPAFGRGWALNFARYDAEDDLADELRDSPAVAEGFAVALASPDAMAAFESFRRPGREIEVAVARLVDEGVLDRRRVVAGVLEALTRQDRAHSQKVLARVLGALELRRDDLADRVPLAQQLLATARGPVTAVLLPPLLDAADDHDIPAIAATVLARTEKAQRQTLLRALTARDARWGREARVEALTIATEVPDVAFAERATRALTDLGVSTQPTPEPVMTDLWTDPPPAEEAGPARVVTPDEASMTAALSRMTVSMDASDGAMLWDGAVRWSHADWRDSREWARSLGDGDLERPSAFFALQRQDWGRVTPESHRELLSLVGSRHTGVRAPYEDGLWKVVSRSTSQILHDLFVSETTLRLGDIPYLLSTPTRTDATLDLATLAARLRGYGDHRAGPVDLFVALTRLEETDPARAGELDGISVCLWSPDPARPRRLFSRASRTPAPADAVEIVRRWVAGGGMPALRVRHRDGTVALDPPTLPVPLTVFGGLPPSLEGGHEDGVHEPYFDWSLQVETDAGMLPGWADLLAARLQRSFDQKGRFAPPMLPTMVASPRPGAAVLHALAATLSHADEDRRLLAVDAALTLMGRGRWREDDYTTCCLHLLASGELRLARLAHAWEQLILAGGLRPLWPTVTAVLAAACAAERKPAGLAELLGMLRRYVSAVPDLVVPDPVLVLASSRGGSKARSEAAAFVEAASAVAGGAS